jgi:hypothetical protein
MAKTTDTSISAAFATKAARLVELEKELALLKKELAEDLKSISTSELAPIVKDLVAVQKQARPARTNVRGSVRSPVTGETPTEYVRRCDPNLSIKEVIELAKEEVKLDISYALVYQTRKNDSAKGVVAPPPKKAVKKAPAKEEPKPSKKETPKPAKKEEPKPSKKPAKKEPAKEIAKPTKEEAKPSKKKSVIVKKGEVAAAKPAVTPSKRVAKKPLAPAPEVVVPALEAATEVSAAN